MNMNETKINSKRRCFLKKSAYAMSGLAVPSSYTFANTVITALNLPTVQTPVLSLFMDQPYFDMSGKTHAYRAPQAISPLHTMSETEWRMRHPYL
jgi:hypothetical protein